MRFFKSLSLLASIPTLLASVLAFAGDSGGGAPLTKNDNFPRPVSPPSYLCGWDRAHLPPDWAKRSVKDYGAHGDGVTDDTDALQNAINSLEPRQILIVPPGEYVFKKSLAFSANNAILLGDQAVLIAQTPNNEALYIKGKNSAVIGLGFRGAESTRLSTPESTQIVVAGDHNQVVENDVSGSASAGIFVYGGHHFRIVRNKVHDTMADGIHMTHGSGAGVVRENTVWHTGDDRIAVVSYRNLNNAADLSELVSNILIEDNNVSGGDWGRGITVVGGENVLIQDNTVSDVWAAAGIYIAQEASFHTFGSEHIVVRNNTVSHIELTSLPTDQQYTHQGAIDMSSSGERPVGDIHIDNNTVDGAGFSGIRLLANICHVSISNNHLSQVDNQPIKIQSSTCPDTLLCINNVADKPIELGNSCMGSPPDRFIQDEATIIRLVDTTVEDCTLSSLTTNK